MKNHFFASGAFVLVLTTGLLFSACSGSPEIIDPSVPVEQSSMLYIAPAGWDGTIITQFDGKSTGLMGWQSSARLKLVAQIPAGQHTLAAVPQTESLGGHTEAVLSYEFIAGRSYSVKLNVSGSATNLVVEDITDTVTKQ